MSSTIRDRDASRELRPNMTLKLAIVAAQRPQYTIAFAVGISPSALSAIVRGISTPSPEQERRIADALGEPVRVLFPPVRSRRSAVR